MPFFGFIQRLRAVARYPQRPSSQEYLGTFGAPRGWAGCPAMMGSGPERREEGFHSVEGIWVVRAGHVVVLGLGDQGQHVAASNGCGHAGAGEDVSTPHVQVTTSMRLQSVAQCLIDLGQQPCALFLNVQVQPSTAGRERAFPLILLIGSWAVLTQPPAG